MPRALRPTARGARYSDASFRRASTSSSNAALEPSTATAGCGSSTRRSTTDMSRGPAISMRNGMIVSAISEPSSGTRARLYTGFLAHGPGHAAECPQRSVFLPDQEDGRLRAAQHGLRHAAEHESSQAAAPVARHHDEVGVAEASRLDDR